MFSGRRWWQSNNNAYTDEAIQILRAAVSRETEAPLGYVQLAMAYGRKGDYAQADLASAQAAYLRGDNKTARDLASRAKPASPSARPDGSRPTISSAPSRCPARRTIRNNRGDYNLTQYVFCIQRAGFQLEPPNLTQKE